MLAVVFGATRTLLAGPLRPLVRVRLGAALLGGVVVPLVVLAICAVSVGVSDVWSSCAVTIEPM